MLITAIGRLAGVLAVAALAGAKPKAPPRPADRIEPFAPDQRLVATYYFNWYIDGRTHKYHNWKLRPDPEKDSVAWTWQPYYPTGDEPGSEIFGLDDPSAWPQKRLPNTAKWPDSDDWLYHVSELRAMKWAKLDLAFVDLWWPQDFSTKEVSAGRGGVKDEVGGKGAKGAPCPEWAALFRAWKYLDQRGEEPIKLSFILETPSFKEADVRGDSTASKTGKPDLLFGPFWGFYRQFLGENECNPIMPRRAIAAVNDERKRVRLMGHLFYPRAHGEPNGEWISRWDAGTFRDLRVRFEGMAGYRLWISVNQHLHGPAYGGWDGVQGDGSHVEISRRAGVVEQEVTWHASLAGPLVRDDAISIGVGYFKRSADALPGGGLKAADGSPVYPRAYRYLHEGDRTCGYEKQWQEVMTAPESFKKHLVVIESWNELIEGTQIAPAKPAVLRDADGKYIDRWGDSPTQYIELTRRYVGLWKGDGESEKRIKR